MEERDLWEPVRDWLAGQGYDVAAEVRNCDVVARHPERPDEIIIVELKRRMTIELLAQAVRRTDLSPSVYVAVPVTGARGRIANHRAVTTVIRKLGIGLIVVRTLRGGRRVEVLHHPGDRAPRTRVRRRAAIVREIDHRYGEFNRGGQTSRSPQYTAYRQRALVVALLLADAVESSPAELRRSGAAETAGAILAANHYGWFLRVARGRYQLTPTGAAALAAHAEVVAKLRASIEA